ncbi:organic cation transporter protein [Anabrus simplex]|uniref:organic cation transporter protein n=1 Tax=Anabrus simplex TaxID=316456 RepID=UPI0035A3D61A
MAFDDIFKYIGEFGPYQRRTLLLLSLPGIIVAFHRLAGVFLHAKVEHRCQLPFEGPNSTYRIDEQSLNASYPRDGEKWSSCEVFPLNYSNWYTDEEISVNGTIKCSSWVYDKSTYDSSIVSEFNLVCDNVWLRATADALFMLGDVLGALIFGDLSDRYGRKPIFFTSLVLQIAAGLLGSFAPEYISYVIARMVIGATTDGVFLIIYVIGMELVAPKKRLLAGMHFILMFSLGYVLLTAIAFFVRDWRMLQIAVTLPASLFLCYWWVIPESPRWLITKGKVDEARSLLLKVAKWNKVNIPESTMEDILQPQNQDYKSSVFDLLRWPNMRKNSLILFYIWFVNSCTYYGLSWNTSNLAGNAYIIFVIAGAVEFPANILILLTLNRWGRKIIQSGSLIIGGVALLLTLAVPVDMTWLTIMFVMIGKMAITASFTTIYMFSAELFPTVVRNVGIGASATCARIGGMMAPYINLLGNSAPPVTFGALTFTAGLLALILPETLGKTLPDTIEEGEQFGKKTSAPDTTYYDNKAFSPP